MVKQGYKQTEIGVIPEDWDLQPLRNIVSFKNGVAHEKTISRNGKYTVVNSKFISSNGEVKKYSDVCLQPCYKNDILMVMSDVPNGKAIAKCFYVDKNETYTLNQRLCDLSVLQDCAKYIFYAINRNPYYLSFDDGVKQTNLTKDNVLDCKILLPKNKNEQAHIADALSDTDKFIVLLEKLIAKKKAVKQGTMQELLTGKKRLPGFTGEWEEKDIKEFGFFISGNGFPLSYQGGQSGQYPFYKVSDFNNDGNGRMMKKANNYITYDDAVVLSCNIIPKDSIVFAKIGAAIALERKRITTCACCIDNNMMAFQLFQKELAPYMCYLFQTIRFGDLVEATALPSLSGKSIGDINMNFPPTIEEQIAIASILSDMDNEIEALEQKLAKTRQIKQGMMQQLLTGKIRLV